MSEEEQDALSLAASWDEESFLRLANTGGLLTAYLDVMLCSVTLPEPLASEHSFGHLAADFRVPGASPGHKPGGLSGGAQAAMAVPSIDSCNAPLLCLGTGKGEVLASGSYHGNPDYPSPYSTTERPEAPPPGLCGKKPAARTGERRAWGSNAPVPRETVPVELLQAASDPTSAAPAEALKARGLRPTRSHNTICSTGAVAPQTPGC
ncbi:UNVERIFIED_CONTAM: hypothetical protein FKN15_055725 [Acipenser sinensis]